MFPVSDPDTAVGEKSESRHSGRVHITPPELE